MIPKKYPYVRVGKLLSMPITDILIKRQKQKRTHNDISFSKEVRIIIAVDIWLHSLRCGDFNNTKLFG